jgi:hypothetical protein
MSITPKPVKDLSNILNCRQISLLNVDNKLETTTTTKKN